jgi:hypothetical protein
MSFEYLPGVKPSGLVVGALFAHASSFVVYGPLFGSLWHKTFQEEKNKSVWNAESKPAVAAYIGSLVAAGLQTYATAALLIETNTFSYKGAAYLGGIIFLVRTAPSAVHSLCLEKKSWDEVLSKSAASLLETIGLALVLTRWGVRTL